MNPRSLKRSELAEVFRVTPRTITRWAADGMPRGPDGRYNISDCIAWRLEQADRAAAGSAPDEKESKWLERYRRERALLARLERKLRQKELMPTEDHDAIKTAMCSDLRNTMLAWPSRAFPNDDEARTRLRQEVFALLESFIRAGNFAVEPAKRGTKKKVKPPTKQGTKKKPSSKKAGVHNEEAPI